MTGKKFIGPFKEAFERFVRDGNDDKGKKLSAARMQEILIHRNPMRYDIPSVKHNTFFVQYLLRKMRKKGEIRTSTSALPRTTQRRLIAAEGGTITPSTKTTNGVGVGGGRSGRGEGDIAPDEAVHALPNMESDDYASGNVGRRGMAKKYEDLIDSICSSGRTTSVREMKKAMLELLGVGDGRSSEFPLITQISNRMGYVRRRNRKWELVWFRIVKEHI